MQGITREQATPELLTFRVLFPDFPVRGGFECSDATLNTLFAMVQRATLSNFLHIPTDCPHREKNGWTGDAAMSCEHTLLTLDADGNYHEWLTSLRGAMREDGKLPEIMYRLWQYRGDTGILLENADALLRYLHYMETRRRPDGLYLYGLGDWAPPGGGCDNVTVPVELTDSLTCYGFCRQAQEMFSVLGREQDAAYAASLADDLYRAVRTRLIDPATATAAGGGQTAQALAIRHGMFTPEELPRALAALRAAIAARDGHFDTGILGARVLFHVLSEHGMAELAYQMIVSPTAPSYGHWVRFAGEGGALPELFCTEDGDYRQLSENHHFFGNVNHWMISDLAGLTVLSHDRLRLTPAFVHGISYARAFHLLPAGRAECGWRREGERVLLRYSCPDGVACEIKTPDGYLRGGQTRENGETTVEFTKDEHTL